METNKKIKGYKVIKTVPFSGLKLGEFVSSEYAAKHNLQNFPENFEPVFEGEQINSEPNELKKVDLEIKIKLKKGDGEKRGCFELTIESEGTGNHNHILDAMNRAYEQYAKEYAPHVLLMKKLGLI